MDYSGMDSLNIPDCIVSFQLMKQKAIKVIKSSTNLVIFYFAIYINGSFNHSLKVDKLDSSLKLKIMKN